MKKKLYWRGHAQQNRHEAIARVKDLISDHEGCIIDFNLFSDLAMSLIIEIEGRGITALHAALGRIINLSALEEQARVKHSDKEWTILLNLHFVHGTGDLKVEVPMVPG